MTELKNYNMKTARIKQIQSNGKSGEWNIFEYLLDDGYSGVAYTKKDTPYGKAGDIITYEAGVDKKGNPKISISKLEVGPSVNLEAERVDTQKQGVKIQVERLDFEKDKQVLIIRQSSIKSAVDFLSQKSGMMWTDVLEHADIFTEYVLTGKIPDIIDKDKPPF